MADSPEKLLNRALAQLLHDNDLAVRATGGGTLPELGIRIDGIIPTDIDECTVLTALRPIADGRANLIYRTQFFTRRTGSPLVVRDWAAALRALLDQAEHTPNILGISYAWEFSGLDFDPDTQGRSAIAATYHFRGRRP
jgi:hypothetical protein